MQEVLNLAAAEAIACLCRLAGGCTQPMNGRLNATHLAPPRPREARVPFCFGPW